MTSFFLMTPITENRCHHRFPTQAIVLYPLVLTGAAPDRLDVFQARTLQHNTLFTNIIKKQPNPILSGRHDTQ